MTLKLVVGNQNYSSWSLRPWIAMKAAGIAFEQKVISLTDPDFKSELLRVSGAGKVPVLIDGTLSVWESLAILEYLGERFPEAMYAPIVSRFHTYAIEVGIEGRRYMEAVLSLPAWEEWQRAARAEPWIIPDYEVDWPDVPRE
jgi:glutathione S-transferase